MAAKASDEEGGDTPERTPDRPLTIDDVPRLGYGTGIAIGCGIVVALAIAAFWLLRGWILRG
jgi:hypothetical protein